MPLFVLLSSVLSDILRFFSSSLWPSKKTIGSTVSVKRIIRASSDRRAVFFAFQIHSNSLTNNFSFSFTFWIVWPFFYQDQYNDCRLFRFLFTLCIVIHFTFPLCRWKIFRHIKYAEWHTHICLLLYIYIFFLDSLRDVWSVKCGLCVCFSCHFDVASGDLSEQTTILLKAFTAIIQMAYKQNRSKNQTTTHTKKHTQTQKALFRIRKTTILWHAKNLQHNWV